MITTAQGEYTMDYVSLLIKSSSGFCNMHCSYCFYRDEMSKRMEAVHSYMEYRTASLLIKQTFDILNPGGWVNFNFQGGEPTLTGLDFYRYFVQQVNQFNRNNVNVFYTFQTNGLLLDKFWADFFLENRFLVGISLDGTRELHDANRRDVKGAGTWEQAIAGLRLLQKKGVDVNALCVVTRKTVLHPTEAYRNLKSLGLNYIQFIPCLDPLGEERGSLQFSLTPGLYTRFLCHLFDEWYHDWETGHYTSVRIFDDYVHLAMGLPAGTCAALGSCGSYIVVESDGSLYPCDFYCLDKWKIGKLGEISLADAQKSETTARFVREGRLLPDECVCCQWFRICRGGCKRDRHGMQDIHNYFCPAFREFFSYAWERILHIAEAERLQSLPPL